MVQIVNQMKQPLTAIVEGVFSAIFIDYQKVFVKSEFTRGRTDSCVFLVQPIRQDGLPELPCVAKVDHQERIRQEWQAYNHCIKNRLPGVAEIQGEPTYCHYKIEGTYWGGLRYPLVGSGTFGIVSFREYYFQANTADICYILEEQLFTKLDALWRYKTVQPGSSLYLYYDAFLPPNLIIEWSPTSLPAQKLTPDIVYSKDFDTNQPVEITGFRVVRSVIKTATLVLDFPQATQDAFRFQIKSVPNVERYKVGEIITQPLTGNVYKTRHEILQESAAEAFQDNLDVTNITLAFSNGNTLPNPLYSFPRLLNHSLYNDQVGCIHADLNLENILVETKNRNAYLIDYINARQDHILHDLLHFEMDIIIGLLPKALKDAGLSSDAIVTFYERLHCTHSFPNLIAPPIGLEKPFAVLQTVRRVANRYLSELGNWTEYYYGLFFYLLGALQYKKEPSAARQAAFLGAAITQILLESPPSCGELLSKYKKEEQLEMPKKDNESTSQLRTETHFHGKVKGQIHTGSGDINLLEPKEVSKLAPETRIRYRDIYSSYEIGAEYLVEQMQHSHPRYSEALGWQARLLDNINRSRRFGDTQVRQADRSEIFEQLNELTLFVLGISFNELCQRTNPK